jgi:hypothetical protein
MSRTAALVLGVTWLFASTPAAAEILVGINGGFVIPGDQDLVFKEYPSGGGEAKQIVAQDKVSESIGPIVGLQATGWGGWSFLRYFGVQGDALYWYMHARGAPSPPAPHFTVGQNRLGLFGSLLARVPVYPLVGRFSQDIGSDWFVYGGAGIGPVYSTASHGSSDWGLDYQFFGGISVPLFSHLRLRVEGRWIATGDVDTTPKDGPGWRVDVSGKHSSLDPHRDSRFVPVIFGLDWRF